MEYLHNEEKVIKVGQAIDFKIPKPIAHISFDAYKSGVYRVIVLGNGSWMTGIAPEESEDNNVYC